MEQKHGLVAKARYPINARAGVDRTCALCGVEIPRGDLLHRHRERALSHAHAFHAGTLYPWRYFCCSCADTASTKARGY
jgi:hypothetical protein